MLSQVPTSKLLLRPRQEIGEGKNGYYKRLMDINGLPGSFTNLLDFSNLSRPSRPTQDTGESVVTKENGESIQSVSLSVHRHRQKFLSIELNKYYSRFCPLCLSHRGIWKMEWEWLFYDVCPEHGCWLVDTCSICFNQVTWKRDHLLCCNCRAKFANEIPVACPDSLIRLNISMLKGITEIASARELSILNECGAPQIQRIIRLLGAYGDLEINSRPQKISNLGFLGVSWRLTSLTAEVLANWPESFFSLLRQIDKRNTISEGPNRLNSRFGNLYASIYRIFKEPCFAFLRDAFEQYLILHWQGPIAKRNTRLQEDMRTRGAWIASNCACKEMGVSPTRLRKLVADGYILGHSIQYPQTGRICTVVRRADIPSTKKVIDTYLDLHQAMYMLGLGKKRMMSIRTLLFPTSQKIISSSNAPWMIPRSEIDCILNIGSNLPSCKEMKENEVSIAHVMRYWMWSNLDIADLITQTASKKISPDATLIGGCGINSWIFKKNFLLKWYQERNPSRNRSLSVPELAICLGIKQEVAYFLVRNNFIHSSIERSPCAETYKILQDSIDEFNRSYVFLAGVAKHLRSSTRGLLAKLHKLEIYPVSGPSIDGGRQVIMRRTPQLDLELKTLEHAGQNEMNYGPKIEITR